MTGHNFNLCSDEQLIFERTHVVLTDKRLLVLSSRSKSESKKEVLLSDVDYPKKYNGGQKSRTVAGIKLLSGGMAALVIEWIVAEIVSLNETVEALLFVVGALSAVIGMYFLTVSLVQVKPNTTLVFLLAEGGEIIVPFPEWDSPEAEELTKQFARAKSGL